VLCDSCPELGERDNDTSSKAELAWLSLVSQGFGDHANGNHNAKSQIPNLKSQISTNESATMAVNLYHFVSIFYKQYFTNM
jgi:hypothetical protein